MNNKEMKKRKGRQNEDREETGNVERKEYTIFYIYIHIYIYIYLNRTLHMCVCITFVYIVYSLSAENTFQVYFHIFTI